MHTLAIAGHRNSSLVTLPAITERVIPDTRAAHFVLGDDKSTWDTAAASFSEYKGYTRAAPLKPASGSNISLGTSPVNYTTAASAAFSSSLSLDTTRVRPVGE